MARTWRVKPHPQGWQVQRSGKIQEIRNTQSEAIGDFRTRADLGDVLIIHGGDGKVRRKIKLKRRDVGFGFQRL